ncbi:MAG: hypothetical protein ACJASV_002175 [Pseudorhodobacter sp.]|jgi:hypothetical protein
MQNRARALMGATALLYFGPLLAGLAGFGWAVVPVFACIFMLWLVILRPYEFPQTLQDWKRPDAWVALGARAAVQLLLVVVCFGIGRGIGGVLGSMPPVPSMMPIILSFLSIPLARLIWDPWKMRETDQILDEALAQIEGDQQTPAEIKAHAEAMLNPLNGLADDVPEAELQTHLQALRDHVDEGLTFEILLERAQLGAAAQSGKRALMLMASDGAALERTGLPDMVLLAMTALHGEGAIIARAASRLTQELQMDADLLDELPASAFWADLQAKLPVAQSELADLIAGIEGLREQT